MCLMLQSNKLNKINSKFIYFIFGKRLKSADYESFGSVHM